MFYYSATSMTNMAPVKKGCMYGLTKKITHLITKLKDVKNSTLTLEFNGRTAKIEKKIINSHIKSSVKKSSNINEWLKQECITLISALINWKIDQYGKSENAEFLTTKLKKEVFDAVKEELKIAVELDTACAQPSIKHILYNWKKLDKIISVLEPELASITPKPLRLQRENNIREKVVSDITAELCYSMFGIHPSVLLEATENAINQTVKKAQLDKASRLQRDKQTKETTDNNIAAGFCYTISGTQLSDPINSTGKAVSVGVPVSTHVKAGSDRKPQIFLGPLLIRKDSYLKLLRRRG